MKKFMLSAIVSFQFYLALNVVLLHYKLREYERVEAQEKPFAALGDSWEVYRWQDIDSECQEAIEAAEWVFDNGPYGDETNSESLQKF